MSGFQMDWTVRGSAPEFFAQARVVHGKTPVGVLKSRQQPCMNHPATLGDHFATASSALLRISSAAVTIDNSVEPAGARMVMPDVASAGESFRRPLTFNPVHKCDDGRVWIVARGEKHLRLRWIEDLVNPIFGNEVIVRMFTVNGGWLEALHSHSSHRRPVGTGHGQRSFSVHGDLFAFGERGGCRKVLTH